MNTNTKRSSIKSPYAVIRCYQPARIELELLAQVFGLVGRGNDDPLESFDSRLESADLACEGGAINDFDSPISRTNNGARLAVLEEVV